MIQHHFFSLMVPVFNIMRKSEQNKTSQNLNEHFKTSIDEKHGKCIMQNIVMISFIIQYE